MEKPQNTIEEKTNQEQNESKDGRLSIENNPETQKTTEVLSKITENIQDGEGLTKEDITDLKESLSGIPIKLGPYQFPAKRLLELSEEDLKKQAEILTEISEGDFDNLCSLKIINPEVSKELEKVGGTLGLDSLTSAVGLVLPTTINGRLDLRGLTSADGLLLPQTISGSLYLRNLPETEKQKLREQRPDLADKIE